MKQTFFALSLGLAGMVLATQNAYGQGAQCGQRDVIIQKLNTTYGETRRGIGIAANNAVMEVFASEATGSWTITVTLPSGVTCLVASGQNYESIAEELPAKGDAA